MTEHQIRRVPTALLIAVVVQTVGGLVWAGGAAARIATLEQRVASITERGAKVSKGFITVDGVTQPTPGG